MSANEAKRVVPGLALPVYALLEPPADVTCTEPRMESLLIATPKTYS